MTDADHAAEAIVPLALPLDEPEIEALVRQYLREMARFEKAAQFVADQLHREVRAATLKHVVTFRAKHPDDLRGKLRKRAGDPRYTFARLRDAMDEVVTDLAGCRLLLYDAADEPRVAEIVQQALPLRRDLPGHCEQHVKASGYRATHLLVGVPDSAETLSFQGTVCEVQVTTLAAHVFNELEHDVGYKDHGVAPATDQREVIANLLDASRLLDRLSGSLLRGRARAVADATQPIASAEELRHVLDRLVGRTLRGDFVRLFRLIAPLAEPLTVALFGDIPARLAAGADLATRSGTSETDDVVCLALGMLPSFSREFAEHVARWRGPSGPLKVAIQRALRHAEASRG